MSVTASDSASLGPFEAAVNDKDDRGLTALHRARPG
jgi:hypothetical protein